MPLITKTTNGTGLKGFLQVYYSYHHEKLRIDKLAFCMPAYKSLAIFVCWFLRTRQTEFFDISIEYIKCVNALCLYGAKYIQKIANYLNLFADFNELSCIMKNLFVRVN